MRLPWGKGRAEAAEGLTAWAGRARGAAGLVVLVALVATAALSGVLRPLDDGLAELRFRLLQRPPSHDLAIVEIDATSVRAAGRWPWGRDRYARAIYNLEAAGAKVVGFDVDFSAQSSTEADRRLQEAVSARPGTVVLPTFVQRPSRVDDSELLESSPLAGIAGDAVLASVNVPVDSDGRVRRYGYGFETPSGPRPSMGALLAGAPIGRSGYFALDYGIRVEDTPHLSFQDIYSGRFDPALVRGRSVLIGSTALELGDEFATPRFGTLPGVYVHALAYESLASGRDLKRLHPYLIVALAGLIALLLRPRAEPGSLRRLLLGHLGVTVGALGLPILIQAVAPVSLDVAPILLAQVLVLVRTVRFELDRRTRAVVEEREAHLVELATHMRKSRDKIRAANRKLRVSNTALDKALKARTEFLASTSHEIRTPLNGILGMTEVMLADARLDPAVRQKMGVVRSAGESMLALMDDILDMAKIENGHLVVSPAEMDLHRLLEETRQLWSARAGEKNVALQIDRGDTPAWITEDVTRLRQIVFNLMSNAIKFTEAGQVALSARVQGRRGGETLVIEVQDTGIGIPPEKLDEIFEPFRQVDGSVTRTYGGTGLGLSISRRLAVAMGGELTVRCTLNEGSLFTVRLPLRRVARGGAAGADNLQDASVLLIEANPLAQSMLNAALSPHVARFEVATSLDDAMAALDSRRFDLVLAEGAALAQGADAAAGLARLVANSATASVAVLWAGAPEEMQGLLRAGARQVVKKPISMPDLLAELRAIRRPPQAAPKPLAAAS